MIRVFLIHPDRLSHAWPRAERFIVAANNRNHGEHSIEDITQGIAKGEMRLWMVMENGDPIGAAITEVAGYSALNALQVTHLGGERMIEWYQEFDKQIEQYAKAAGCQMIQFFGRKGWARAAASLGGYEQQYVVMGKRIAQ